MTLKADETDWEPYERIFTAVIQQLSTGPIFSAGNYSRVSEDEGESGRLLDAWVAFGRHAFHEPPRVLFSLRTPGCRLAKSMEDSEFRRLIQRASAHAEPAPAPGMTSREQPRPVAVVERLAAAERAAAEGDVPQVGKLLRSLDWSQATAKLFERGIRAALAAGATGMARELAAAGARAYPEAENLGELHEVLAPPDVLEVSPARGDRYSHAIGWLRENGARYLGQWVALREGKLIASGKRLVDLKGAADPSEEVFITRVR